MILLEFIYFILSFILDLLISMFIYYTIQLFFLCMIDLCVMNAINYSKIKIEEIDNKWSAWRKSTIVSVVSANTSSLIPTISHFRGMMQLEKISEISKVIM